MADIANIKLGDNSYPLKDVVARDLPFVNVKSFGAVGDAMYFNKDNNQFYKNSTFTTKPTSDVNAFTSAINYCKNNKIKRLYCPSGRYYLPNFAITLKLGELEIVGDGDTCLCSEKLTSGNFITITSDTGADTYCINKSPLRDITLWGTYANISNGVTTIKGLAIGGSTTVVMVGAMFENIAVRGFNLGLDLGFAYKSTFLNVNISCCNYGVYIRKGGAIPISFINSHIWLCRVGLTSLGTGYEIIQITNCSFEYNLSDIASGAELRIVNTRFEGDLFAGINSIITCSNKANLFNCQFLYLPNFVENASPWINNAESLIHTSSTGIIYATGPIFALWGCNINVDAGYSWTGTYPITGVKLGCYQTYAKNNIINTTVLQDYSSVPLQ